MKSYATTTYASPARASRVHASPRALKLLARISRLEHTPFFVLVNAPGDHLVVVYERRYDIRTSSGVVTYKSQGPDLPGVDMLDDHFLHNGAHYDWDGGPQPGPFGTGGDMLWALEYGEKTFGAIDFMKPRPTHPHGGDSSLPLTNVRSEKNLGTWSSTIWDERLEGAGAGAISEDRRFALAMEDGRFLVLDGNTADSTDKAHRLAETKIGFLAYDLSIVSTGFALLEAGAEPPRPRPLSEFERPLFRRVRQLDFVLSKPPAWRAPLLEKARQAIDDVKAIALAETPPPRWRTIVHHLGPDGVETFRHEIPFEVLQPPIDAGRGRIYLMGNGTAAIQDGKLLFATPYPTPMFGTAFEDGTMAISAGAELRIVGPDGQVRQTFTTAEHEPITTPPAIGSDGSVWVGTTKALYVAR